jgi:broad specificity phosphatase PhoE
MSVLRSFGSMAHGVYWQDGGPTEHARPARRDRKNEGESLIDTLTGTIHLVRHGEVENPKGVIYGRLPGYNLSERGERQARAAGEHLKNANVGALWASPLERAQETAQAIAEHHSVEITTDERLIESDSTFEGVGRTLWGVVRNPLRWWHLRNPLAPSWGESFSDIRVRMASAIEEALQVADGRELIVVSHQTPVMVSRLALTRSRRPPWLDRLPCETGSVTTLVLEDGRVLSANYFRSGD